MLQNDAEAARHAHTAAAVVSLKIDLCLIIASGSSNQPLLDTC